MFVQLIYYADDDKDELFIFGEAISKINAQLQVFSTGELLLKALNHLPPLPDLIFVDLNMPILDGYDVIKAIKSSDLLKTIPVIVFSTSKNIDTISKCMALGANLYITKPMSLELTVKAINFTLCIDWNNFNPTLEQFYYKPE